MEVYLIYGLSEKNFFQIDNFLVVPQIEHLKALCINHATPTHVGFSEIQPFFSQDEHRKVP